MKHILIVDDDPSILKITKLYLTKNGYEVEEAYDGQSALDKIRSGNFELVVLDLMLPKVDGWAVCRQLRENQDHTPIIMLTARGEVHERIEGLRMGADDYLVKPFDPNELLARIDSVLRRSERKHTDGASIQENRLKLGNLSLRMDSFTVSVNLNPVSLTRREFDLLAFLIHRPGKVFSREDLIAQIWGWDFDGEDRVVDLYIQRIRRKLGTGDGWHLTTVWGVGYKFEVTP
jgi:two-component system response regulator ResD